MQLPPGARGKTLRGKVGWALCMFYNFTLKTALCVYITYFCTTKLSRTFTRVWISPCGGKGECCEPTPCHQPESEQLLGKQNWTQGEGKTTPPMLFISYPPLRARCCGDGCSVVKTRSVFSQPNCSDNQGQEVWLANIRRGHKRQLLRLHRADSSLDDIPHFIFLIQQTSEAAY